MSNPTESRAVRFWSDPYQEGEDENSWPPPPSYADYLITGHLADLIRERTGETGEVHFVECTIEGGYSEWTVEHDYQVTVTVGSFSRDFEGSANDDDFYDSAIPNIQRWLQGDE